MYDHYQKKHHHKHHHKLVERSFNFRCVCISRKYLLDIDIEEVCPPCQCRHPYFRHELDNKCFCC